MADHDDFLKEVEKSKGELGLGFLPPDPYLCFLELVEITGKLATFLREARSWAVVRRTLIDLAAACAAWDAAVESNRPKQLEGQLSIDD